MKESESEQNFQDEVERTEVEKKRLAEIGRAVINQFYVIMKVAQIYEPNNDAFVRQRTALMQSLQKVFQTDERAVFIVAMRSLFLNRVKILAQFLHYANLTFIINLFEDLNISTITFTKDVTDREFTQFIYLLARREKRSMAFETFKDQLAEEGIKSIAITKMVEQNVQIQSAKLLAKRLFAESINGLKGIMKDIREGREANGKKVRRLVQGLIDLMDEHEMFMLGLTTTKNVEAYTLNHSLNVCLLSLALGRRLGLERKQLRDLGLAAIFHDLGNLLVPKEILEKPTKLTDEEFRMIEDHPLHGAEMMMEMKGLGIVPVRALRATLEHHIKADMTGYPKMWKQRPPDLFSKIIEITDCFDAATTSRPYRPDPRRPEDILKEMMERGGVDFDAPLLKVFVNMIGLYPIGSLVALDTNELAIVMGSNPDPLLLERPRVKVITDQERNVVEGEIVDLSDYDPQTNQFRRTIVASLDAHAYGIDPSRFF
jgi:HD-GYP domain-containing protein (c-di-GMP phosphodiesterase class II)